MKGIKNDTESLNKIVNILGGRIIETEQRISRLEEEEAKTSPIMRNLVKQNQ